MTAPRPSSLAALAGGALRRGRAPAAVTWVLTERCNYHCDYCDMPGAGAADFPRERIPGLLEALARLGTRRVTLTGGEPFHYPHVAEAIEGLAARRISIAVNTNGTLLPEFPDLLARCAAVKLSLDGPEATHDRVRGAGQFAALRRGMEAARRAGARLGFTAVLTRENLDCVEWLVAEAERWSAAIDFQPPTERRLGGTAPNPLLPETAAYRAAIDRVAALKRAGRRAIKNSLAGLAHLRKWPDPTPMRCNNWRLAARVDVDGEVRVCGREAQPVAFPNAFDLGLAAAFEALPRLTCTNCWCGPRADLNLALDGSPGGLVSIVRMAR